MDVTREKDPFYLLCLQDCEHKLSTIEEEIVPLKTKLKRLHQEMEDLQVKRAKYQSEYHDSVLIPEKILTLPDELLLKPLSFLSKKDLLSAACVCSRFNRMANDQTLWRNLLLRDARIAFSRPPSWTSSITNWKRECLERMTIRIHEVGRKLVVGSIAEESNHWAIFEPLYLSIRALRQRICSFVYLPPHKVRVRVSLTKPKDKETDWGFFLDDQPRDATIRQLGFKDTILGELYVSVERLVDFDTPSSSFWWPYTRQASVQLLEEDIDQTDRLWIPSDTYPWFLELSQAEVMQHLDLNEPLPQSWNH